MTKKFTTILMEVFEMKTEILCNVNSCKFHKENRCHAKTISVGCDQVLNPSKSHETACESFNLK